MNASLCRHIDHDHPAQVEFLRRLVRLPSDNPPGDCVAHARMTASLIAERGFEVEHHAVPGDKVRASGMISITNLIVRRRFGPGPTVALNAHGDVVPPGEGWSVDPYAAEVHEGVMYGRGVAVSKSDIATYLFALEALEAAAKPAGGCVELHFTYDEETGGLLGPAWLLAQGLSKPDYAICAGFSYGVVVAHNGCLHLEVKLRGRAAHAALPDSGVDALQAAARLLSSLYLLREGYRDARSAVPGIDSPTLVVGLIDGGINTNVVPDTVILKIDRRIIPEESPEQVERALRDHIESVCAATPGIRVEIVRILLARPLVASPGQHVLADKLRQHAATEFGVPVGAVGSPLYTDARHYAAAGIPTVLYGAGPRTVLEANGHRADERLMLEDLRKATRVVALTLSDLLPG